MGERQRSLASGWFSETPHHTELNKRTGGGETGRGVGSLGWATGWGGVVSQLAAGGG